MSYCTHAVYEAMLEVLTFGLGSKVRGATKVDDILDGTKLNNSRVYQVVLKIMMIFSEDFKIIDSR